MEAYLDNSATTRCSKAAADMVYKLLTEGIFTMDFQNDGEFVGGCIAGGRNYFHINANGDAEPCVFIHYSGANIRTHSMLEILKQPLFMHIMITSHLMRITTDHVLCLKILRSYSGS